MYIIYIIKTAVSFKGNREAVRGIRGEEGSINHVNVVYIHEIKIIHF